MRTGLGKRFAVPAGVYFGVLGLSDRIPLGYVRVFGFRVPYANLDSRRSAGSGQKRTFLIHGNFVPERFTNS